MFPLEPFLVDECSNSLMAESCTCRSAVRNVVAKPLRYEKHSAMHAEPGILKKAEMDIAKHAPTITVPAD